MKTVATSSVKTGAKPVVRAALLRSPLQLLGLENRRSLDRLKREFKALPSARFAESLLDAETYLDRFERADFLAPGAELFLRAGQSPDLSTIGLFGKAAAHSETLWDALLATQETMRFSQPFSHTYLRLRNGRCRIIFESGFSDRPGGTANVQYFVALYVYLLRMSKWRLDADLRLYYPNARSAHFALFPEAIRIRSCSLGMIDFNDKLLRSPLTNTKLWMGAVAKSVASKFESDNLGPTSLPTLIREMQSASLKSYHQPLSLNDVADLLDLPVRTVQAHLKAENTSFADIRNNVRHQLARQELQAGRSVMETSELLGFDHRQSFSESFAKWEGQAPSVFASRGGREIVLDSQRSN